MTLIDAYLDRTPRSRALFERATTSLPGGSTRTTVYAAPYPPYIESGAGLQLRDVDGNVYRDFLGNYTSLILGHAHPAVVAAVEAQVRRGSAFAAPTETEVELAEEIRRRVPSVERLRFTTSGTEATMFAIRAARAFTGRPLIGRFDRSYHGTHDGVMVGTAGVPERDVEPHRRPAVGRPGWHRGRPSRPRGRPRRDHHRARPGRRRRPRARAGLPAVPALVHGPPRGAADLRRDHLVPGRARRGAGAVRRPARPDDARQDHRRRLSAGRVRRAGGRDGHLRRSGGRAPSATAGRSTAAPSRPRPGWRRLRAADARHVRPARRARRAAPGRAHRGSSSATASTPASPPSARCSRSSRARA